MQKTTTAIVAAASLAATVIAAPKPAEARCIGCWVGAGIAAAVIGGVFASRAYGYGYGYPAYGLRRLRRLRIPRLQLCGYPAYSYGYGYPAYSYAYSPVVLPPVLRAAPLLCTPVLSLLIRVAGGTSYWDGSSQRQTRSAPLPL